MLTLEKVSVRKRRLLDIWQTRCSVFMASKGPGPRYHDSRLWWACLPFHFDGELARLFSMVSFVAALMFCHVFLWWACWPLFSMVSLLAAMICLLFFLWGLLAIFGYTFLKWWPCSLSPTSLKIGWTWTSLVLSRFGQSTQAAFIWGKIEFL